MEGWDNLPDVLLLHIYAYLSFSDRLSASSTCKNWREILFHPLNWPHVRFCFVKDNPDREKFLKLRTGHFLSSCSVHLPIELRLHRSCGVKSQIQQTDCSFNDAVDLFYKLCHNKNLSQLSIVQSDSHCPSLGSGGVVEDLGATNLPLLCYGSYNQDRAVGAATDIFEVRQPRKHVNCTCAKNNKLVTGVITRSKSHRMKQAASQCCTDVENNYLQSSSFHHDDFVTSKRGAYPNGGSTVSMLCGNTSSEFQ